MTVKELLKKQGIRQEDALRESALLSAFSTLSRYEAECSSFAKKHGVTLEKFKLRIASMKESENFDLEDDLMEWEFAAASLKWIKAQLSKSGLAHV